MGKTFKKQRKFDDWDDDYSYDDEKKSAKEKRRERRLNRALKTMDVDEIMEYDQLVEDGGDNGL